MGFTDVLLPPRCASCARSGWPLCAVCGADVGVVVPPMCARCGRPTEEPLASCAECPPRSIDSVRAAFIYDGPLARAIRGMKFSGWRALAAPLASAIAEVAGDGSADVVTWVPLSRRRRARRGFDQAELLARRVARLLGVPSRQLLARRRNTTEQARRRARDRRSALRDAFAVMREPPASVVLVDDVLTTGSTAAACASALKAAGAGRVDVLVAARSLRSGAPPRCYGHGPPAAGSLR